MKWLIFLIIIALYFFIKLIIFSTGIKKEKQAVKKIVDADFLVNYSLNLYQTMELYLKNNNFSISEKAKLSLFIYISLFGRIPFWDLDDSILMASSFNNINELLYFLIENKIIRKESSQDAVDQISGKKEPPIKKNEVISIIKSKYVIDSSQMNSIKKEINDNNIDVKKVTEMIIMDSFWKGPKRIAESIDYKSLMKLK